MVKRRLWTELLVLNGASDQWGLLAVSPTPRGAPELKEKRRSQRRRLEDSCIYQGCDFAGRCYKRERGVRQRFSLTVNFKLGNEGSKWRALGRGQDQ